MRLCSDLGFTLMVDPKPCEITPVAQAFETARRSGTFRPSRFSKRTALLSQAGLGVLTLVAGP